VAGFQFEPGTARSFLPKVEEHFLAVETGALLAYIKKTWGFDRIAFVREDEGLFQKMTGVFEKAAQSRGWTVTGTEVVGPKTDFAALWKKLRDNKTQFVRFILRDGINFAKTYGQVKPPILAFGNLDGGTTKEFWKQTDGGAEGIIFHHKGAADVPMHYHSSWWQKQYQERFADYPTTLGDDVYVAIHGFARAIETVKTLDPELVAVTLEKLEFPVGPGYFGWYPDSLGSCHIRGADRMRAVWSSQWHPGGKLVPVWNEALHGERDGFPLAQRYFVQGNLRFPHGLEPQPPK